MDKPHMENPDVDNPDVDNPHKDNPAQINTNQVITQEIKDLVSNNQSINLDRMDGIRSRPLRRLKKGGVAVIIIYYRGFPP